jgi:hypothetical protein
MRALCCKPFQTLVPIEAAFGLFVFLPQKSSAKPEFTHITKQECAYCHASLRDRKLTEAGLYFRKHRTLKGYRPGIT